MRYPLKGFTSFSLEYSLCRSFYNILVSTKVFVVILMQEVSGFGYNSLPWKQTVFQLNVTITYNLKCLKTDLLALVLMFYVGLFWGKIHKRNGGSRNIVTFRVELFHTHTSL